MVREPVSRLSSTHLQLNSLVTETKTSSNMKFKVTLKDPDGFYDGITDAVEESLSSNSFMSERESEAAQEARRDTIKDAIEKWVEYGEYITIEFDTEAKTATVVPL